MAPEHLHRVCHVEKQLFFIGLAEIVSSSEAAMLALCGIPCREEVAAGRPEGGDF